MSISVVQGVPELSPATANMLREALRRGWRDLVNAPTFAIVLSAVWILGGWVMLWITAITGQTYWLVLAAAGFPLIAPFAAVGFYDVSRRLEHGTALDWRGILSVIARQSSRQLPSLCAVILFIFLFWFFLAHMIFALFMGLSTMTNVSSSFDVFLSSEGVQMLATGTLVGSAFAMFLYAITVVALPLLLDRDVDFVTAMITSVQFVSANRLVMLVWGAVMASATLVSMLPGFLGLVVTLPLFGHASWHLYDLMKEGGLPEGQPHTA